MRERQKLHFHGEAWKIEARNWKAVRRDYYLEYGGKYQEDFRISLERKKIEGDNKDLW